MGVRLKRLEMASNQIYTDTIALSDDLRKVCSPDGYHPQAFGPKGRRAPLAVMTYRRQALVIIVILTTMVRGTSTVFNGTAIEIVFAIFHLPHADGAITMLALIVIR